MRDSSRPLLCALGCALWLVPAPAAAQPATAQATTAQPPAEAGAAQPAAAQLIAVQPGAHSDGPQSAEPSAQQRESRTLTYAGLSLLLAGMLTDASFWAVVDKRDDAAPWAWHLVPIAGPVIGLTDVDTLCPGGDSRHGCSLPKGMAYVGAAVSLVLQSAGLVLLLVPPSGGDSAPKSPQRAQARALPLDLAVSQDRLLLRAHWAL